MVALDVLDRFETLGILTWNATVTYLGTSSDEPAIEELLVQTEKNIHLNFPQAPTFPSCILLVEPIVCGGIARFSQSLLAKYDQQHPINFYLIVLAPVREKEGQDTQANSFANIGWHRYKWHGIPGLVQTWCDSSIRLFHLTDSRATEMEMGRPGSRLSCLNGEEDSDHDRP